MGAWQRVIVAALAFAVAACAPAAPRIADEAPLRWPEEIDEPARVEFVGTLSRPRDLGIEKSFAQRVSEFFAGEVDARLVRPMAVVAVAGAVYVADPGARGVHRFDGAHGRYDLILRENEEPFPSPVGLAVGTQGEIYVADSVLGRVFVIGPDSKAAVPAKLASLEQPTGVAYDGVGKRLFVADTAAHRVIVLDEDGVPVQTIGERGEGDGQFNYPTYLWRDNQRRLYVTDSLNYRIQVFDAQGRFLRKFGRPGDGPGDFMRQKGIATDSFGHVYVVDGLMNALQIYDEAGRLLLSIGNLGRNRGEFWLPAGIFIGEDDRIYVADAYNGRVQVFRYVGGAR